MRARILSTLTISLAAMTLIPAASHADTPECSATVVEQALLSTGKLTQDEIDGGEGVNLVRCGDMTGDGLADVLFTLASGGTAGDTHFGVLKGRADGSLGARILYKQSYKVGIARHNSRSFDVMQPYYAASDPNCCPSSFRQTRYTWNGKSFKAGKAKKLKKPPARFYES